jgi:hypothetical protein
MGLAKHVYVIRKAIPYRPKWWGRRSG